MSSNVYAFLYKGLDIKVGGTVSEMYDDNITHTNSSDNKKEDFTTKLTLGLGVKYEGKTRTLDFTGRINQHIFAKHDNFNNMSEELELNFQNEFSKYDSIRLKNTFTHANEPRGFEETFEGAEGRYGYYRNKFNLDYVRDISKQFTVIARYTNQIDKLSRKDLKDSYLNTLGFEADYIYNADTVFLMSYDFSKRTYDDARAISIHTVAASIRRYITKQLYFDGTGGVDFITSFKDTEDTGEYIQGSLTDEIDENTAISLSFTKRKQTSSYREDFFDSWRISGLFKRQLLERLDCSLSGFYGEGKYKSLNLMDRLRGTNIVFSYNLRENLKGDLTYTYSDIDSTNEARGYTRNTMLLGLTTEF
jgi:hypothetical protein